MAYAVIQTGGKQYKVAQGDEIEVEKLELTPGTDTTFNDVLLYADGGTLRIGADAQGVTVTVEVLEQFKGDKVIAYKYRRRKGYHRTVGHRRQMTRLKVKSITA